MREHQNTILYKSIDNIMKYGDFERLCLRCTSDTAMVPVLAQQLLLGGQLAKMGTEFGYEVVKLSPLGDKGLKVTDMDIGILRYCSVGRGEV